ncbi:MAG TPA: multidrug effflux MFS transporter [Thermomicrobiales bacterium]|nr:multidrug effflux MFS transporter [Thermomicrobiales bacterium]
MRERAAGDAAAEAIAPAQAGGWRLVVILGALSAFGPLSIDMYLPGLPGLQREFGASASAAQLTLSACMLGLAAGQVLAGPLSDRLGRRRPLLAGLAAFAVVSLLCALAPSVWALIGLRLLQGLAGAAGIVIARAIVRDLHTGVAMAKFFSLLMLVNGAAPVLAPLVGGQLLRIGSWRGAFVTLFLIGIGLFLAGLLGAPETLPPDRRSVGGVGATIAGFGRMLRDRAFVGYALAIGLAIGAMFGYIAGSPFVLQDIYGLSPQAFSLVFGTNALGLMAMGPINARLVERLPLRALLAAGLVASAAAGVGLLLAVIGGIGLAGILPAFFVIVASLGFILPNATTLALASYPRAAGSASALLGLGQYVVGAIAAPLVGVLGAGTALPMAIVIAALSSAALLSFALTGWSVDSNS